MQFLNYLKSTGQIISVINSPEEDKEHYISETMDVIDYLGNSKKIIKENYILNNEVILRPIQTTTINKSTITADGIDAILITNAPVGIFTATSRATEETITGEISGSDTFSTTIPGTYKITITAFPFLDFTATIEAI